MLRYIFKALVGRLAGVGLPLAALAVFALTSFDWVGYVLCLAAIAFLWSRTSVRGLGHHLMPRVIVVSAVLIDLGRRGHLGLTADQWPLTVSGIGLLCLIAYEPLMVIALRTGRTVTHNLDVVRVGKSKLIDGRPIFVLISVLTLVFGACAAFDLQTPIVTAIVAIAAIFSAGAVLAAWRIRKRYVRKTDSDVRDAVQKYAPKYMVHMSAPVGSEYQLLTWLPYLDRLGEPYLIVLREKHLIDKIAQATDKPIVLANSIVELENLLVPSLKAVLYVNNGGKNLHMIRFTGLEHVFIGHGDSDKASSYSPVTAIYDRVWVAGRAGVDRYAKHGVDISLRKFRIVGRPQLDKLKVGPVSAEGKTVVYAPTWAGAADDTNYSSLGKGVAIVQALLDRGATIILRPHPFVSRNAASVNQLAKVEALLTEDAAKTGRKHLFGEVTSRDMDHVDCFNMADAMISDVSGVASDWLYSERPFAITDMHDRGATFTSDFPLAKVSYVLDKKMTRLSAVLDDLLGEDPKRADRLAAKTYYLGDFPAERYSEAFTDEVVRIVEGRDHESEIHGPATAVIESFQDDAATV
ncbi:glycosyl transferase [Actinorhabdospora filicis]|uniref:Glycosyl transferase n=1 Tax=Actinorhabdospora filicis TaxID=1785913 RepID=A0A9W6STZ0_9ACTN|nr:CDP-glycerol glycerophosphotransferase family protein [Actinorhabdospora filicis]GLZ81900.1 glycosyl transferase [Actinorhabdospora filicis]